MEIAQMAVNNCAIVWFQKAHYVHGYNVHKELWKAAISNTLVCLMELGNSTTETP